MWAIGCDGERKGVFHTSVNIGLALSKRNSRIADRNND